MIGHHLAEQNKQRDQATIVGWLGFLFGNKFGNLAVIFLYLRATNCVLARQPLWGVRKQTQIQSALGPLAREEFRHRSPSLTHKVDNCRKDAPQDRGSHQCGDKTSKGGHKPSEGAVDHSGRRRGDNAEANLFPQGTGARIQPIIADKQVAATTTKDIL